MFMVLVGVGLGVYFGTRPKATTEGTPTSSTTTTAATATTTSAAASSGAVLDPVNPAVEKFFLRAYDGKCFNSNGTLAAFCGGESQLFKYATVIQGKILIHDSSNTCLQTVLIGVSESVLRLSTETFSGQACRFGFSVSVQSDGTIRDAAGMGLCASGENLRFIPCSLTDQRQQWALVAPF
ncbi:hypothetical protein BC829DRAFT_392041 [Chytridium lagenaria]|nr:hypothetical protein BC829DRAFT_392041 [Chytridium lagenaria]